VIAVSVSRSRLSEVAFGTEAGEGIVLIVEGGDQVQQAQNVERKQCAAGRAYETQVAALPSKPGTNLYDDAESGTIHVTEVGEIQQDLAGAIGDQLFQLGSQQIALTIADGGPALKVQDGDIAGLAD